MDSQSNEFPILGCMDRPTHIRGIVSRAPGPFGVDWPSLRQRIRARQGASEGSFALIRISALLFILALPADLLSQTGNHCQAPANLENALAQHPSAAVYDALGAHFASQRRFSCAISAFESAVRMQPNSWQGHYDLGVALLTSGHTKRAADELS